MCPRIIRTPTLGLIFDEKNAYYTRKITGTFVKEQMYVLGWRNRSALGRRPVGAFIY